MARSKSSGAPSPTIKSQDASARQRTSRTTPVTPVYGQVAAGGYDAEKYDLAPWIEVPSSTRVSRHRYDHLNRAVQVQWRNNKNQGYIYLDVQYESYRAFARAASTGKAINNILNAFEYRPMTPDEYSAGSNTNRKGVQSRVRQ